VTYKYQKCPSCFELSIASKPSCLFCNHDLRAINYHPWRRFFARCFDTALFYIFWMSILALIYIFFKPSAETIDFFNNNRDFFNHPILLLPFNALLLIASETVLLAIFGNTPGKKLHRIKLNHTEKKKSGLKATFNRTLMMYLVGMGVFIPLINFYAMYLAHKRLVRTGNTLWDIRSNFHVSFKAWSRWYLIWVFLLNFLVVLVLIPFMMVMSP